MSHTIDRHRTGCAARDKIAIDMSKQEVMRRLASKYIWWNTPEEAAARPERVAAQVMDIGDYDDVQAMAQAVGDDYLRDVLQGVEAGQLDARSWTYWHYRLGLAAPGAVPPLPLRRVG